MLRWKLFQRAEVSHQRGKAPPPSLGTECPLLKVGCEDGGQKDGAGRERPPGTAGHRTTLPSPRAAGTWAAFLALLLATHHITKLGPQILIEFSKFKC